MITVFTRSASDRVQEQGKLAEIRRRDLSRAHDSVRQNLPTRATTLTVIGVASLTVCWWCNRRGSRAVRVQAPIEQSQTALAASSNALSLVARLTGFVLAAVKVMKALRLAERENAGDTPVVSTEQKLASTVHSASDPSSENV